MGNNNVRHKEKRSEFVFINSPIHNTSPSNLEGEIIPSSLSEGQSSSDRENISRMVDVDILSSDSQKDLSTEIEELPNVLPGFSFNYTTQCEFITDTFCCICFEDHCEDMLLHMLPCNHIIHKPCLIEWFSKSSICPICKYKY